MKSMLSPSNIVFGVLLILLVIPKTRSFIQVSIHTLLGKINTIKVVLAEEQKTIIYTGQLSGINTNSNIDFIDLKGKVIFINFWATWCPPCIAEMQSLQDLYSEYQDEVIFLFVTNDASEKTNVFLRKHNYTMPCYNPKTTLPLAFGHSAIPTTYVVNKQGKIVIEKEGAINWNKGQVHNIINQLLKE